MSKVTQQAFTRRAPNAGVKAGADGEPNDEAPVEEPGSDDDAGDDLKATVTLSGEALAALLEEVKNAQRASASVPKDLPEELPDASSSSDAEAAPRRGPQRHTGKT